MNPYLLLTTTFFLLLNGTIFAQEDCFDGVDNDGDGLIDMNDSDCECDGLFGSVSTDNLIPNPSFENKNCCPTTYSEVSCAENWSQASDATSDYWNLCGLSTTTFWDDASLPLPGAEGDSAYAGFIAQTAYLEYIGNCLIAPMKQDSTYELKLWIARAAGAMNLDLTLYGTPNCGDLPWTGMNCPIGSGSWEMLGQTTVDFEASGEWIEATITIIPSTDINAVAIGSACDPPILPPGETYNYYYVDELSLTKVEEVSAFVTIEEAASVCNEDLSLIADINISGGEWNWVKDGIGLAEETNDTLTIALYGSGNYSAIYTLGDACVQEDFTLLIPTPTVADFMPTNVCFGQASSFTDASTAGSGTVTAWNWNFGDGNTSTSQNPEHTYNAPGDYTVNLTITTSSGCLRDTTVMCTVNPKPETNFTITNACAETILFTDASILSTGDIVEWNWEFGDGNTSLDQNASNNFDTIGTYNVTLTTITDMGCVDDTTIACVALPPLVANFTSTNACSGEPVSFTDFSVTEVGAITGWSWNFGDGHSSTLQNPSNSYSNDEVYNVSLTVTNSFGCVDSVSSFVDIFEQPTAFLTSTSPLICNADCIEFRDESIVDTSMIVRREWNFGNGITAGNVEESVACYEHNLEYTQYYDVALIVTNSVGCKDTMLLEDYVSVDVTPVADFELRDNGDLNINNTRVFFDNTTLHGDNYIWEFGDNSENSTDFSPEHLFPEAPGKYQVTLNAYSPDGSCHDTYTKEITVNDVLMFYIPNAFTPDGNAYNETFQPVFYSGYDPQDFHMVIYNRMGDVLFETYNAQNGWDGMYGNRELLESDVYVWQIEFKESMSNDVHKYKGNVTVLR
ncbi:MAG: PKD domain-containing protein [Flavobacteriales bacterium]|nr:PKD domain-containing protein [Flavobacteriales bacterium]